MSTDKYIPNWPCCCTRFDMFSLADVLRFRTNKSVLSYFGRPDLTENFLSISPSTLTMFFEKHLMFQLFDIIINLLTTSQKLKIFSKGLKIPLFMRTMTIRSNVCVSNFKFLLRMCFQKPNEHDEKRSCRFSKKKPQKT